jgi:membrane-bound serine protease (ClpP class)
LVTGFGLVALLIVTIVARSIFRDQTAGVDELLGMIGESRSALSPEGKVFVRGEYWTARSEQPIGEGERVEVTAVEGLCLRVRPETPGSSRGVT